jgi:DNA-binding protein HU-beta
MTKAKIFEELSERTGIKKVVVEGIIEAFITSVKEHILSKETISLSGFGNFTAKRRAAKIARNISQNTIINLPAHYIPAFKPSKKFVAKVKRAV